MRPVAAIAFVTGMIVFGACAQSGYDPSALRSKLERAGLSATQARCITDEMEKAFDVRELVLRSDPTAQEITTTRALLVRCGVSPKPPR